MKSANQIKKRVAWEIQALKDREQKIGKILAYRRIRGLLINDQDRELIRERQAINHRISDLQSIQSATRLECGIRRQIKRERNRAAIKHLRNQAILAKGALNESRAVCGL